MTHEVGFKLRKGFVFKTWAIYGADFETFAYEYYLKHGDTDVYAVSCKRAEVAYDKKTHRYVKAKINDKNKNKYSLQYFVNIRDYLTTYLSDSKKYGKYQLHFFHNGIKFDFNFLVAFFRSKDNPDFRHVNEVEFDEVIKNKTGERVWCFNDALSKFKVLKVASDDCLIEFRDSIRLWRDSIKGFSKELKSEGIDIPKTDLDPNHVQKPFKSVEEMMKDDMIRDRVGNDSLILAKWLEQRLTDGVTFLEGSDIPYTAPQLAIQFLTNFKIHEYGLPKQIKRHVWDYILGCTADKREEMNEEWASQLKAYRGGICSFHVPSKGKVINQHIYAYDMNSMYPTVCQQDLPIGLPTIDKKLWKNHDEYYVFVEMEFDEISQKIRTVPAYCGTSWIDERQTISKDKQLAVEQFKRERKIAKLINQKSKKYGIINNEEIEGDDIDNVEDEWNSSLNEYVYDLEVPCHVIMGWNEYQVFANPEWFSFKNLKMKYYYFKKEPWLRDFMKENYKIKQECGHDNSKKLIRNSAKLKMNSTTGKFGEKTTRKTYVNKFEYDAAPEYWLECKSKHQFKVLDPLYNQNKKSFDSESKVQLLVHVEKNYHYMPAICAITSGARAILMKTSIEQSIKHNMIVLYSDTDSMKCTGIIDADLIDDNELGKWKCEGEFPYMKIIRAKVYAMSNDGVNFIVERDSNNAIKKVEGLATSGVDSLDVAKTTTFATFDEDTEIPSKNTLHTHSGRVVIYESLKKISSFHSN